MKDVSYHSSYLQPYFYRVPYQSLYPPFIPPPTYADQVPYPVHFPTNREFPPVNTHLFTQSIISFRKLMKDGSTVLDKLAEPSFAYQFMTAAQAGNQKEIDRFIKQFGVDSVVKTKFTPAGVHIIIDPNVPSTPCCTLTMYLRWGS